MSLYREAGGGRGRWIALAAALALLIGGGAGFALGRSSAPEPSISEQLVEVRARVQPVLDGIALVPDHYAQGVRGGEVVGEVQYSGAQAQAEAAQTSLDAVASDLEQLDPAGLAEAREALSELIAAIDAREDAARVDSLAERAATAVSAATGADSAG